MFREDRRVMLSYGIHPLATASSWPGWLRGLRVLLGYSRTVALGEIGLDYNRNPSNEERRVQHEVLASVLPLAIEFHLPVVVHCRDNGSGEASPDCLAILTRGLPREQVVHRHCFNGSYSEAQDWLAAFPDCVFGITGIILHQRKRHQGLELAVQSLPLQHLVLETDAPYLWPPKYREVTRFCNPGMLADIAVKIAELKGTSVSVVLEATRATATRVYNL